LSAELPRGHLPPLDGLRGVAVLAVLAFHFLHLDGPARHPLDRVVLAAAGAGWCGVDLFFVLSGFLITGLLLDAKGAPGWLGAFWGRRVLRIFPLHYAYLAALFLLAPRLFPAAGLEVPAAEQAWFWGYAGNVLFARRGTFDGGPALAAHFWSLAVEEQFYLAWPLVVWALPRRGVALVSAAAIAGAGLLRLALLADGTRATAAYVLTPCRMDALAVGAAIAALGRAPGGWAALVRAARPVAAGAAAAIAAVAWWRGGLFGGDPAVERWAFLPLALLSGAALVLAVDARRGGAAWRALAWRPLAGAGRYAYGLYVLHYPVFRLLEAHGVRAGAFPPLAGSRLPGLLAFAALAGGVSVAAALASWHLLERRCLALRELLPGRAPEAG
jgi:peptidoglycan/LPS O-acetylase OafA/YrhL